MRVLYIEDSSTDADLARRIFAREADDIELVVAATLRQGRSALAEDRFDAVLLDLGLPDGNGVDLLAEWGDSLHALPVVVLSGRGDQESALAALKAGAHDYVTKRDDYLHRLPVVLRSAVERESHHREPERRMQVLYAEPNVFDVDLARRHFARHAPHIRLDVVATADEVLARLDGVPAQVFDALVLDYRLPGIDGLELAGMLRREHGIETPIVLLTGHGSGEVAARALRIGVDDYMPKREAYLFELAAVLEKLRNQSELRRERAELEESERRFRSVMEHMPAIAVQGYDSERRVIFWNAASESLYGYRADEALGQRLEDLIIPPPMRDDVVCGIERWLSHDEAVPPSPLTLMHKSGEPVQVFSSHAMLRNIRGEAEIYCIDIDLREQHRVQQALSRSETRYREVVDNVSEVIFRADMELRWTFLNPAWEKMSGFGVADALGRSCTDFIHLDDREMAAAKIDGLLDGRSQVCRHDARLVTASGEQRWVTIFARHGGAGSSSGEGVFGTISDVTERISQRQLQQARAEVLDRVVADAPVADVIRTIIARIESMRPRMKVAVLFLDADTGCLGGGVAPSLPDFFVDAFEGLVPAEGRGSCGAAAYSGKPVVVEDVRTHPNWAPWVELTERAGVRACWSRPLRDESGRVLGTFSVYHAEPHVPDADELELVEEFANLASVALQRRLATDALRTRERALALAANAVLELLRESDVDAALTSVLREVGEKTGVDRSYVFELQDDPEGEGLLAVPRQLWARGDGVESRAMEHIHIADEGLGRWIERFEHGDIVIGDACDFPPAERRLLERGGVVSLLAVPIYVGLRLWGFIGFDALSRRKYWSPAEENVLRILASSVAAALERKGTLDELRRTAAAFGSTRDGIVITDLAGTIVTVNPAYCEITGYGEDELIGGNPRMLHSERQSREFYDEMWRGVLVNGYWEGEIWNRRKNGEVCPQWLTVSTVRDVTGAPVNYVGVMTDISRLKRSEAELQRLAHYDPLTELPNRVMVRLRLEHALGQARRQGTGVGVLFIDLDRFKNVNDSFGHPVGDELLVKIAQRLRHRLREADTLARLGGDEFLLVMDSLRHPDEAQVVARALLEVLEAPFMLSTGQDVYVGASIGISLFPEDGVTPTELIQHADAALYQAKAEGRSTYRFFTAELGHAAQHRVEIETRLRRALEREEFVLYYQPQIDTASGRVIGAEALLRWRDPKRGLVAPDEFIGVAEECGLISALGEWSLRAACRQAAVWDAAGLGLDTIAVNLSGRQLWQPDLPERIAAILAETGLVPERLELELTESSLIGNESRAGERLHALKALGLRLALDDFGTGYSSLAYLKRFPIDVLKIDREFVKDIPHDSSDMEIAAAIIAMAHALRMHVVAEGVETEQQLDFLRQQGCDAWQGYYRSRPVATEAFESLLGTSSEEA